MFVKRLFFIFVLILSFGISEGGFAKLDENFRDNFPEIVKELCHSGIEYSIDDEVGMDFKDESLEEFECKDGKCREYHDTMNCLFQDGLSQAVTDIYKEAREASDQKDVLEKRLKKNKMKFNAKKCEGKSLGAVQNRQRKNGFVSTCEETPHLTKNYSSCKVAEAALLEFCGYQKFLGSKMRDLISYKNEEPSFTGKTMPVLVQQVYQAEMKKSSQALTEMIDYYRNITNKYRLYVWLVAVKEELEPLRKPLIKFWENIALFPDKFVNPSKD